MQEGVGSLLFQSLLSFIGVLYGVIGFLYSIYASIMISSGPITPKVAYKLKKIVFLTVIINIANTVLVTMSSFTLQPKDFFEKCLIIAILFILVCLCGISIYIVRNLMYIPKDQ